MATWAFYSDSALTNALSALTLTATGATYHFWLGSQTTGRMLKSSSTGAQLTLVPTDSATGGHATTAIRLSLTSGGVTGATPGATLNLGTSIVGAASGASEIWAIVTDAVGDGVLSTELSLVLSAATGSVIEQAVT